MHQRIALILLLVLGVSVAAEDAKPAATNPTPAVPKEPWAGFDLDYLAIKLKSTHEVRRYVFQGGGMLSASVGKGDSWGEHIWRYKKDGDRLLILNEDGKVVFRMRPLKTDHRQMVVDNGHGKKEVFAILEDHKSEPEKLPSWDDIDLFSRAFNLKSRVYVQWYYFHPGGSVSVSMGMKKGAIAAPLDQWRRSGQWLQILDYDGKLDWQMRPLKIGANEITVDNGRGGTEVYELQSLGGPTPETPAAKKGESK
jgi:hypothetical protein